MKGKGKVLAPGKVELKVLEDSKKSVSPLENTLHSEKEMDEVEKVIEEIALEIKPSDNYKNIEKKLKEKELEEEKAKELGFNPDNYYSAKEKKDEENELERNIEGDSASFSGMQRSR